MFSPKIVNTFFPSDINSTKHLISKINLAALSINYADSSDIIEARIPDIDLSAVGGNQEVIDSLGDFVRYLQDPKSFSALGVKMPKGIILSGTPGVGKSFMAEALAGHAGVPFFAISASSLQDTIIGGTEKKLRNLFAAARKAAPCVLCIDEIDSLGQKRFDNPQHGSEQSANCIVNQLLTLLSEDNGEVVVVATTNTFETLDPALVRPGRFDRHITVTKPDVEAREQILKLHTKNKQLSPSVSLSDLAKQCAGYSGAELATLVNEAALNAARNRSDAIDTEDFDQARVLVRIGIKGRPILDPEQKQRTAFHEAAHALIGHLLHHTVYKISILQHGTKLGFTENLASSNENLTQQEILDEICISLAGRAAEKLNQSVQMGNSSDLVKAKKLAHDMIQEGMGVSLTGVNMAENIEFILNEQLYRACKLLEENRHHWERVSKELIQHNELRRDEFLDTLAGKTLKNKEETLNAKRKIILPLPPAKKKLTSMPQAFFNKNTTQTNDAFDLPFTLQEVAKSIEVSSEKIRNIIKDNSGGFEIKFKPSFKENDNMEIISKILKENDVENVYLSNSFGGNPTLHIYGDGFKDFLSYVNKKNAFVNAVHKSV